MPHYPICPLVAVMTPVELEGWQKKSKRHETEEELGTEYDRIGSNNKSYENENNENRLYSRLVVKTK